jgi:putative endonuclease
LLNRRTANRGTEGSNPSFSASLRFEQGENEDCRDEVETEGFSVDGPLIEQLSTTSRQAYLCFPNVQSKKMTYFYVYILESKAVSGHFYTGYTLDLEDRLKHHNDGAVASTKPYRPWRIKTFTAFTDESRAHAFEQYLKTQSGRAFAKKHL